jgi:hypothetical protein
MSTVQLVGGGRRSAAPQYNTGIFNTTEAVSGEQLLRLLMQNFALQPQLAAPGINPAPGSGIGNEENASDGATADNSSTGASSVNASTIGAASQIASALGTLTGTPALSMIGSVGGLAAANANASPAQALGNIGVAGLSALGVPGAAISLGANAINGNMPGMVNSAIALTNPVLGAINTGLSVATGMGDGAVTLGDIATNIGLGNDVFGITDVGPIDATQGAMAINNSADPIGSLIGALGNDVSGSTDAAVGAANAISAANNTDSMDALMDVTSGFGTAETVADGGGSGAADGTVICTHMHKLGYLSDAIYKADKEFGEMVIATSPGTYLGYIRWAPTIVEWMKRPTLFGKFTVWATRKIAVPWAYAMAEQMGVPVKSSRFGRFLLNYGLAFCTWLGPRKQSKQRFEY